MPPTCDLVRCEVAHRVATITLNRPDVLNAVNRQMREELAVLLEWCAADTESVGAVVLAGEGRAFCSGQDLKESSAGSTPPVENLEAKRRGDFQTTLADLPQPTVAALHGYVLGRGLEIALTCDIRIAADDLQIGLPEVGLGMIPGAGGTVRLPRLIGAGRALHLLLTTERLDAETAYSWGLVTQVVPPAELSAAAQALAERLAVQAPLATRYSRRVALEGAHLSIHDALQLESTLAALLLTTHDREEGVRAFREKRPPRFRGS